MIAVRPTGTTPSSHVAALAASPDELAPARARLRGWLGNLPVSRQTTFNILASVGEALNNAIEHGSGLDGSRTVSIEAFASEQAISVTVGDSGRWSKDSAAGLAAAALVVDLSHVGYFDSAGFAVVDQLLSRARLAVVVAPGSVLRAAALLMNLPFHDSIEDARAALLAA